MRNQLNDILSKYFKNFHIPFNNTDYGLYDIKIIESYYPYRTEPVVFTINITKDGQYDRVEIVSTGFELYFVYHKLVGGNLTGSRQQVLDFIDYNLKCLHERYTNIKLGLWSPYGIKHQ